MSETENFIEHFGVKGMRWGSRKTSSGSSGDGGSGSSVKVKITPKNKIKTTGGGGNKPTDDAISAAVIRQKAKKSGIDSLSSQEIQFAINRMTAETKYANAYSQYRKQNQSFFKKFISTTGKDLAIKQIKEHGKDFKKILTEAKSFDVDLSKIKITSLT